MATQSVVSSKGRIARIAALILTALVPGFALAQTNVSGTITINTQWRAQDGPFEVVGDVFVADGATLTIEAGTTVYMHDGTALVVQQGALRTLGTVDAPVVITSSHDRAGDTAAPGDWNQLRFLDGTVDAQTLLQHTRIRYGGGLLFERAGATLNAVQITGHASPAISTDLNSSLSGTGNSADGNAVNGIAVPAGDITGNVQWGLRGIPYVVTAGVVSIGTSPTISSISPSSIQQGDTVTVVVSGTGLSGLAAARFADAGLTAQLLPGSTATQANLSVTAAVSASIGPAPLTLLVDAGEVLSADRLTVTRLQPTLTGVAPSPLYAGQGSVELLLSGRNFLADSQVEVDGTPATTQYLSPTQLRASIVAPTGAGNLSLRLRTPDPLAAGQYLVSNALTLPVVAPQLALAPTSAAVAQGSAQTFTLSLPYPAPAGGLSVNLVSSVPSVASVPATVSVAQGENSASFQLAALAVGATVVTASKPGFVSAQAQVSVVPPPTLTLAPGALTLGVGRSAEVTLQSNVVAGPSGLVVALSSTNPSVATVPAQITIPAGSSSATFTVVTSAIGSTTLQAHATDFVAAGANVTVRAVALTLPSGVLVAPGLTRSIPLTLSDPAPAGGLEITLASANPSVASVAATISVAEGALSANFDLSGIATGATTVSASAPGYQGASLPVTVEAVSIGVGSPGVSAISLPAELTQSFAITLSRPAPLGGVLVSLATADTSKATVAPASVFIAEGQTSGGVTQAIVTGVAEGSTALLATAPGLNGASIPVTVTKKAELVFSRSTVTAGKGLKIYASEVYVYRRTGTTNYAPNQALTVDLASSDPSKLSVPATVTIPANASGVYFTVTGVDLTAGTPVTIDAGAAGYSAPSNKLTANVVPPTLNFNSLDTARSPASARDNFRVFVTVPGANYPSNQTAAADLPIDLAIVQANPGGIVAGFYDALTGGTPVTQVLLRKDQTYSEYAYVETPATAGSYQVQASVSGASATSSLVTVSAPELKFSTSSVTVGRGLKTYSAEVSVYRAVNGQNFNGADPLVVSLVSSDPTKVSVPATVTIPANNYYTYFTVTGVDLTAGIPATIDATAAGYSAPVSKITVTVVAPTLNFSSLDTARSTDSARDNFRISVTVPGAAYPSNQTAAADLPIALAIVGSDPAGIVDGFYDALTGGTPTSQVLLRKDQTSSDFAYVATPSGAGTYRVQASAAGGSATSALVTVTQPELKFSSSTVTVGKGLKNYGGELYVTRIVNGQAFNGSQALTVNLTSGDPGKASVPATVTIPANGSSVSLGVTGVDLTAGAPVTIDASAPGYGPPATKLTATVIAPVLNFNSLDTARTPASTRDNFRLYVTVPGSPYPSNQTAAADLPIDVAVVQANPPGIVDGIYGALTGGSAVSQVVLRKDQTYSDYGYVGTPNTAGSYQLEASAVGASATSPVVTVSPPELKFSTTAVTVGTGLKTYVAEVSIQRAASGQLFNGTQAVTVSLACSSAAICSVPSTVTIPAGQASVNFTVEGKALGNTTVTASAIGYTAAPDLAVNVVPAQLNFSGVPSSIAAGAQSTFRVYLTVAGAAYPSNQTAAQPITVNLTSAAPGVATVPPAVTIDTGNTYSPFVGLSAVAAGTTSLTASGPGLTSVTSGTITVTP